MKSWLIPPSADLVEFISELIPTERAERCIVVFPGKRPGYFLKKHLAEGLKRPFRSPLIFSMDEFVDYLYEKLGFESLKIGAIDSIAILYEINRRNRLVASPAEEEGEELTLDEFLPWGFKLFRDLEELCIENVKPDRLRDIQGEIRDIPERVGEKLLTLSEMYVSFYDEIEERGLSTRATRYRKVAEKMGELDLSDRAKIVLAGFFALTSSEKQIFEGLKSLENTVMVFQKGPGIEKVINSLGLHPDAKESPLERPYIQFHRAADLHGEAFELANILREIDLSEKDVAVLPDATALFPVYHIALPADLEDYNISMGYPLMRTPIYALLESTGRAQETCLEGSYFVPDYLRVVLHPYVKNVKLRGESAGTRVLFHGIEEALAASDHRFVSLDDLEADRELLGRLLERIRPLDPAYRDMEIEDLSKHLSEIHRVTLRNFETIANLADFAGKLMDLVSFVSTKSPVNRHPFSNPFIEHLLKALVELELSDLAGEAFSDMSSYFRFLRNYIRAVKVPFEGTPLKGFQVLGFLETRNIKFRRVFILDVNEGILPDVKKEDTILSDAVRRYLNLPSYKEREQISRYYFELLIRGSRESHIFYVESANRTRSRFVESLIWELQREAGKVELPNHREVFFRVDFSQDDPQPIPKDDDVLEYLRDFVYSPTSLDTYLRCPLSFYYRYVLHLREKEDIAGDLEYSEVGILIHSLLKEFFEEKRGKPLEITQRDYERMDRLIDDVFSRRYGENLRGIPYLFKIQTKKRMKDLLDYHRERMGGAVILDLEKEFTAELELPSGAKVRIQGKLDRIERRDGLIRIIDYKTGGSADTPNPRFVEDPMETWSKKLKSVQLPFYILLYSSETGTPIDTITSSLLLLGSERIEEKELYDGPYNPIFFGQLKDAITSLLDEILRKDALFKATKYPEKYCGSCPYRVLCGRQWVPEKSY